MDRVIHLMLSLGARLWDLCIFPSAKTHLAAVIGESWTSYSVAEPMQAEEKCRDTVVEYRTDLYLD